MSAAPVRLLVDVAAPQAGGRADSPWLALAPLLAADPALQVNWLDRGHVPLAAGLHAVPFPSHGRGACAADSLLVQQLCDALRIDVFASTGWTTPAGTASIGLVDEPWLSTPPALAPQAQDERALALRFSRCVVCASDAVRQRVRVEQPDIDARRLVLAGLNWCGGAAADWRPALAEQLKGLLQPLVAAARSDGWMRHAAEWRRLRQLQASVDV